MENYALVIAGISAVTALVAVTVGPLVQLYVAKLQFRSSVLSANRQEWINTLRDQIAEQIADISRFPYEKPLLVQNPAEYYERVHKMRRCTAKIQLLLNPAEEDHRQFVDLISRTVQLLSKPLEEENSSQLTALQTEIVSESQKILKREWERVKEGK